MSKKLKTRNNPEGRYWPDEITLDVGSNMPMDVYGIRDNEFGVLYVRHDVATKRIQEAVEKVKAYNEKAHRSAPEADVERKGDNE